jgi:transcriptional regulator with XRE-family HTH domain
MPNTIKDVQNNLRKVRKSKGLTLHQVETMSNGKYKSVVVGSYERGSRSISVNRLIELAELYDVSITEFFGITVTPPTRMALVPIEDLMAMLALKGQTVIFDGE